MIPKGFIKDSNGVYRRKNFIYKDGKILRESTLLINEDSVEEIKEVTEYETLDEAIRLALSYNSDLGNPTRQSNIYIVKSKDKYSISEKDSKDAVAIITPDNNVYELNLTKIIDQSDVKELSPEKGTAEAPKEETKVETKPKEFEDLKENEIMYTKQVYITNNPSESIMFADFTSDYDAIIQFCEDYAPKGTKPSDCSIKHFDKPIPSGLNGDGTLKDMKEDEDPVEDTESNSIENSKDVVGSAKFAISPKDIDRVIDNERKVSEASYTIPNNETVLLSDEDFKSYCQNLQEDKDFLSSFQPEEKDTVYTVLAVKNKETGETLLINNSKSSKAHYVAYLR